MKVAQKIRGTYFPESKIPDTFNEFFSLFEKWYISQGYDIELMKDDYSKLNPNYDRQIHKKHTESKRKTRKPKAND